MKKSKFTRRDFVQVRKVVKDAEEFSPNVVWTSSEVLIDLLLRIRDDYARALRKIKRMGGYAGRVAGEALR